MKITFIVPSWHYFFNPFKLQPYWEMYYATILEKQFPNAKIDIYDLRSLEKKILMKKLKKYLNQIFIYFGL